MKAVPYGKRQKIVSDCEKLFLKIGRRRPPCRHILPLQINQFGPAETPGPTGVLRPRPLSQVQHLGAGYKIDRCSMDFENTFV
jgi:hypothetical protein